MEATGQFLQVYRQLQGYVGWTDVDRHRVVAAAPIVLEHCSPLVDDFYEEIRKREVTRRILTGGPTQIKRLKRLLREWLEQLVSGEYDEGYVLRRKQVGLRHVEIGLPQIYTGAALSRLRTGLVELLAMHWTGEPAELQQTICSLNKLLDLDLAIIDHAYEEEHIRLEKLEVREHSEAKFRGLVESAECVIVILNEDSSIAYLSPYGETLTGYSLDEVQGDDYLERFLDPEEAANASDYFADVWLGSSLSGYQYDIVCRDGSRRRLLWNARRLSGNEEGPMLFTVGHDITSMLQAQAKALQSERLAAIGQTSAGLAHESRNALQRIQASVDLLELEVEENEEAMAILRQIQAAQEHLRQLFDEVRGYAAEIILDRTECSLSAVWRESWELLRPLRAGRDIQFYDQQSGLDLTCMVDHFRLVQVFRNLLENALAASEDPVKIKIACRSILLKGASAIHLSIQDNGPGFDDNNRDKIFSPFFTTKPKGTGLGMAIAQRIVEAHGGLIGIGESDQAGGKVVISLPRK